ncbi:hypothetical protein MNV49_000039 [Pseudohyphozyma bogoriensis]|nr:hypothetical protein MNV49_000039 [Pseudohyphozyma bogoriensis]
MPLTPDSSLDLAFDASLIPAALRSSLPAGLHLRPLASTDYHREHLVVLANLTEVPDMGYDAYVAQFNAIKATPNTYFPIALVDESSDKLVAVGTVMMERKIVRNCGLAGHIEDIAVGADQQGKGLGKLVINVLTQLSESLGAYKTILDCDLKNEGFYVKCGYKNKGAQMAKYK